MLTSILVLALMTPLVSFAEEISVMIPFKAEPYCTVRIEALAGAPKANVSEITVPAGGSGGTFVIAIDEPGEYKYHVWQLAGSDEKVEYDARIYTVTVEVMIDANEHLSSMVVLDDDDETTAKPGSIGFSNRRGGGGGGGNGGGGGGDGSSHRPGFPVETPVEEGVLGADREPAIDPAGVLGASRLPQVAGVFRTGDTWPLALFGALFAAGLLMMLGASRIRTKEDE